MATPLKHMRSLLSPKICSPLNNNSPLRALGNLLAKKLEFNNCEVPNIPSTTRCDVKINVIPCETKEIKYNPFILNTPNKLNVLKRGIQAERNVEILGKGSFGTVVKGLYKGKEVAIKVVKTQEKLNEINVLNLRHEHLIQIMDIITKTHEHSIIIMEFLEKGRELQSLIDDPMINLDYSTMIKYCKDIASGLSFCHENDILHLDLKPSNIIVTENCCKICDFGSSRLKTEIESDYKHQGTVIYTAPEILCGEQPTYASDIYSLGVIFWQLRYRKEPFGNIRRNEVIIYKVVKYELRPSMDGGVEVNDQFQQLYKSCWHPLESARPKIDIIFQILKKLSEDE